jgi:Reactive mitochondrial oxygen species modulator 1.
MENQYNELEEMRRQMAILKEKLDGQEIVNERLIRRSMLSKMSFFKKYTWVSFVALAFIYVTLLGIRASFGLSWWFYGFTVIIMTADVVFDWYINRFSKEEFMEGDLLEAAEHMARMRRLRKWSLGLGLTMLVPWLAWLYYEVNHCPAAGTPMVEGFSMGFCVGGVIGLCIGLAIYFKMQRINRDIIRQIEDLKDNSDH